MSPSRIAILLALLFAGPPAVARAAPDGPRVLEHSVTARCEPSTHRLVAEDRLSVASAEAAPLRLDLAPGLALRSLAIDGSEAPVPARDPDGGFAVPVPAGRCEVTLRYSGEVFDAVHRSEDLAWVVGDATTGAIFERGVYLSGASRWVPRPPEGGLAHYHVTSLVPAPFFAVTQGSVPVRSEVRAPEDFAASDRPAPEGDAADGVLYRVAVARSVLPTDALDLVAGPYVERSREVEGVRVSTWFYEAEAEAADLWLDSAEATVKRYGPILGPYPHPKFDVVENFFQSGYGMPSFTLLGDEVIRYVTMGARRQGGRIPPGYLDHEYVHGWFGNGLFVDYGTGNWCEAITTYFSNYLALELESAGAARAHRRGVLEKFSIRVRGEKDYPLRRFRGKTEDLDNDIGYGKGSLLFHLARRHLGDERFFASVREFARARRGTVVTWDDWIERAFGTDLRPLLLPYLERPGLPEVEFAGPPEVRAGERGPVRARVRLRQKPAADGGGPWPLVVTLRTRTASGEFTDRSVDLSSGEATVSVEALEGIAWIEIDPHYHLLRRIAERDLPPCLNRTLETPGGMVAWRGAESVLRPLAEQFAREKGLALPATPADADKHPGPLLLLEVSADPAAGIEVAGIRYDDPAVAVLVSAIEDGRPVTRYTALSEAAAARARSIPFYGWDPWVVFREGRPLDRDPRTEESPSTRVVLFAGPDPAPGRARADVERLCARDFEGRRPGTGGHDAAVKWLIERMAADLEPAFRAPGEDAWTAAPFKVRVGESRPSRDIVVVRGEAEESLPNSAWYFAPIVVPLEVPVVEQPPGLLVLPWGSPLPEGFDDASAVAWVLDDEQRRTLAPWLDTPDALTPESEAELARPGRDGRPRPRPPLVPWISGRRTRAPALADLPYRSFAVSSGTAERLRALVGTDARVRIPRGGGNRAAQGRNLVGLLRPTAPDAGAGEYVVLSAHYDAMGQDPAGWFPGADDNASGVAAILSAIRGIRPEWEAKKDRRVGVAIVFFDAEEWGLLGSRAFVENLGGLSVRAVVNVDSVGRALLRPVHILGLSTHPDLARDIAVRLEEQDLRIGPDIDRFGYEHGSDHWPFHEKGIPAVTLWASDYATMNTVSDTPDRLEYPGIARLARALRRFCTEPGSYVQ